jgi:hypothetical protein
MKQQPELMPGLQLYGITISLDENLLAVDNVDAFGRVIHLSAGEVINSFHLSDFRFQLILPREVTFPPQAAVIF